MLIPRHLEKICDIIETSKNSFVAKIKCKCGCNHFIVYEFIEFNNTNVKPVFSEIIRENDKLYFVKRNFFGNITEKLECENTFGKKQRKIIKVKCEKCGAEYVLFDNYKHGYDAVFSKKEISDSKDEIAFKYKKAFPQSVEVFVKIYQDVSYDQFKEEFEDIDYSTYLNSFGNIEIYSMNSKSKKLKICSEETA